MSDPERQYETGHIPHDMKRRQEMEEIEDKLGDKEAIVSCTHGVVNVLTTDGETKQTSVCKIDADDIVDGKIEWPPTGECDRIEVGEYDRE